MALVSHDVKHSLGLILSFFKSLQTISHLAGVCFHLPFQLFFDFLGQLGISHALGQRLVFRHLIRSVQFLLKLDNTALEKFLEDFDSLDDYIFKDPLSLVQIDVIVVGLEFLKTEVQIKVALVG